MSRIIDPANSADDAAFSGIRDLAHIASDAAAINMNPLFQLAEAFIVDLLPDTELRTPPVAGKGRTYVKRASVITALQFLSASNFLRAGGSIGGGDDSGSSEEETERNTGEIKTRSVTVGPVTESVTYHGPSSSTTTTTRSHQVHTEISHESRADWLDKQAYSILEQLGATIETESPLGASTVLLTRSRLDEDVRKAEEDPEVIGDLSYIRG